MLLEELTVCDFGLFSGEHRFQLTPVAGKPSPRPIVLFGGLNGAGKTTILNAVRLALYGRQSIGRSVSQRSYEEYLADRIHKAANSLIANSSAHVALAFRYFKQGKPIQYKIARSWSTKAGKFSESLDLYQDGDLVSDFSREQCQAFLNELVPIGVSDLFFFDGEKIASLAEDEGDSALRDAIRKLLGLDIIDRLSGDLYVYSRRMHKSGLSDEAAAEVAALEAELEKQQGLADKEALEIAVLGSDIGLVRQSIQKLEEKLIGSGGDWAVSREALRSTSEDLLRKRAALEMEVLDLLSGLYPIALAPSLVAAAAQQLEMEVQLSSWQAISTPLRKKMNTLATSLAKRFPQLDRKELSDVVLAELGPLVQKPAELDNIHVIHAVSDRDVNILKQWVNIAFNTAVPKAAGLRLSVDNLEEELASIGRQLERAPHQEALSADFEALKSNTEELGRLTTKQQVRQEQQRRFLWRAVEIVRQLKKKEIDLRAQSDTSRSALLANQARLVLHDFSDEIARRKLAKLEQEFLRTFSRLAQKEDAIKRVSIDASSFKVTLYDQQDRPLNKKDLSAGEKQIYAVAMLDALASTSGRKLPVIIDTPLGRLDSQHRTRLIENYFPQAGHQVIILSTDTEIDQRFYKALSDNISHAYHLVYDESTGSTHTKRGFFWKNELKAMPHAS